ncbi:MAG: hypothetical protein QGI13_11400 [Rhodospirillales bacterium]|jgi:hypothetical protein|nr:hypothetical protein [Rhodospirillales bacterium]
MRYKICFHEVCGEWLVFDTAKDARLIGMHPSEVAATAQVRKLEDNWCRSRLFVAEPAHDAD